MLVIFASRSGFASVVTVPDSFPTVQSAIDSGADTVLIREGSYPETPQAYRGVILRGIGPRRPQLDGLAISNPYSFLSRRWEVSGIDFVGPIEISTFNPDLRFIEIRVLDCTLRMGLQHVLNLDSNDIEYVGITGCVLDAACVARARNVVMESDTVDAGVRWAARDSIRVEHCWFRGWSGPALHLIADDVAGVIADNLMEDCTAGIYGLGFDGVSIVSNTIRGMRDAGIEMTGAFATVRDNHIEGCGVGIRSYQSGVEVHDNMVLNSHGTGMWFAQPDVLRLGGNVVGFADGPAVAVVFSDNADLTFIRNTLFKSLVSGLDLGISATSRIVVQNNIGFANGGWGLKIFEPQESVSLGCNDWFGNGAGAVGGVQVSDQDFALDPGFCDVLNGDVRLYSDSPLLNVPQCPQIGARGVECSPPILKSFSVASNRAGLGVAWEFAASSAVESWIERAEQTAGPWDALQTPRSTATNRFDFLDRAVAPDRSYYYRTAWFDRGEVVRSSPVVGTWIDAGRLSSVFPNPANGEVAVDWVLVRPGATDIRVFDLAGREVSVVARGTFDVGRHQARWDGRWEGRGIAPAGMYIVRISNGERTTSHRILLLR